MSEYLGDLGLILLLLIIAIIIIPIASGIGFALLLGVDGFLFVVLVAFVCVVLWCLLYYLWWL